MGLGALGIGCCCDSCTCLRVTISGVLRGTCGCTWCDDVNGTFDLEETVTDTWEGTLCTLSQPYYPCNMTGTISAVLAQSGSDWYLTITIAGIGEPDDPTLTRIVWRHNFGTTKPTCAQLAQSIEYYETYPTENLDTCDATASALTVSLPDTCAVGEPCTGRTARCGGTCSNGNAPEALEVTVPASWTNNRCTECNDRMSGTFVLDLTATACTYQYSDVDVNGSYVLLAQFKTYNSVPCLIIEARIGGACGCAGQSDVHRWKLVLDDLCSLSDCSLMDGPYIASYCCRTMHSCGFGFAPNCRWDGLSNAGGGDCIGETCAGSSFSLDVLTVQAA